MENIDEKTFHYITAAVTATVILLIIQLTLANWVTLALMKNWVPLSALALGIGVGAYLYMKHDGKSVYDNGGMSVHETSKQALRLQAPVVGEQLERLVIEIEKGQQVAGHFPSDLALSRARRVLAGEMTTAQAFAEIDARYR